MFYGHPKRVALPGPCAGSLSSVWFSPSVMFGFEMSPAGEIYQVWEKEYRPLDFMDWKTAVEYSYLLKVASAPQPHVISHYVDDFGKVKCSTSVS